MARDGGVIVLLVVHYCLYDRSIMSCGIYWETELGQYVVTIRTLY